MDNYLRPSDFNEYGVTQYGFRRKLYSEILADKMTKAREVFGVNIDTSETSFLGLLIRNAAWEDATLWEYLEQVYYSPFVDSAEGTGLDNVGMYLTITRRPATKSKGLLKIIGTNGTLVPKGFKVSTADGKIFETLQDVEINGDTFVSIESIVAGKQSNVNAGTVTEIINPLFGVDSVINVEAIEGGLDVETDNEFRKRYKESYSRVGGSTVPAITAALLDIDKVVDVDVRENVTMETVDGIPPKAFECFVYGGEDDDIFKAIFDNKAAGIEAFGTITKNIEDNKGNLHKIGFTRPKEVEIWVKLQIVKDDDYKGDEALKRTVINYIGGFDSDNLEYKGLSLGQDVTYSKLISAIMCPGGILDVDVFLSTDGQNWTQDNIEIARDEIARVSLDRIVIE